MGTTTLRRLALLAVVAAAAAVSVAPASANFGLPGACADKLSQPFLPWLDPASYVLAPDGGFEAGAGGWSLEGGARTVAGNEPWHVGAADDSSALALPRGSRATSPELCLSLAHPTVRFFARDTSVLGGLLLVEAEVEIAGVRQFAPLGVVPAGPGFAPTLPLPLLANLTSPVGRLRFTALGGELRIDDVYIDPFKVP